jgi:hypothetical protein
MNVRLALKLGLAMTALAALALVACGGARPVESTAANTGPSVDGCPVFPADNPWNTDISKLPVGPKSQLWLESVGLDKPLHPDFGTVYNGAPNGIPYVTVHGNQPEVPITFEYADESDPGPYPIPDNAPVEGGPNSDGDRHVLVIDVDNHKLYEVFRAFKVENGWKGSSGAVFDLRANTLRPEGWTSADAAGLPIFPGLVRYDEAVEKGAINHAVRFTVRRTQRGYIHPATHFASRRSDPDLPPMGMRVRLRADYDISGFPKEAQVVLTGLKRYGMILADNGGDWFVTGAPDSRWNDENLQALKRVKVSDFEVVDTGPVHTG